MFTRSTGVMPYSTHVKRTRWRGNTTSNSLDGVDGGAGNGLVMSGDGNDHIAHRERTRAANNHNFRCVA